MAQGKRQKLDVITGVFAALYIVLPSYFAIEVTQSLPLLTGSRILLLGVIIDYIYQKRYIIPLNISYDRGFRRVLNIFFCLIVVVNVIHFTDCFSDSLKELFVLVFEGLFVVWVLPKKVNTICKLNRFFEIMIYSSGVVAVISIISTFIGKNLFNYLNLVSRSLNLMDFTRFGLIRPQAGFDHAVHYGLFCAVMCIIVLHYMDNASGTKFSLFAICFILNIIALFLSNSRGSLTAFIATFLLRLVEKKSVEKKQLKRMVLFLSILLLGVAILACITPQVFTFAENVLISLFASLINPDKMSNISGFGMNTDGILSRTTQLSGVEYVMKKNLLFGMGSNADDRGLIQYLSPYTHSWYVTDTYDVGYIEIFCNFGLVGFIGYILLYATTLIKTLSPKINDKANINKLFKYIFITYFIGLLTVDISGTFKFFWVLLALYIGYINIINGKRKS